jgi:hypothetical protein
MELETGITAIEGFSIALPSWVQVDKVHANESKAATLKEVNKILHKWNLK